MTNFYDSRWKWYDYVFVGPGIIIGFVFFYYIGNPIIYYSAKFWKWVKNKLLHF